MCDAQRKPIYLQLRVRPVPHLERAGENVGSEEVGRHLTPSRRGEPEGDLTCIRRHRPRMFDSRRLHSEASVRGTGQRPCAISAGGEEREP